MDPLSCTASAIAVVTIAVQLVKGVKTLRDLCNDVDAVPRQLLAQLDELNVLARLLNQETRLKGDQIPDDDDLMAILELCDSKIQRLVESALRSQRYFRSKRRAIRLWGSIRGLNSKDVFKHFSISLIDIKMTLVTARSIATGQAMQRVEGMVSDIWGEKRLPSLGPIEAPTETAIQPPIAKNFIPARFHEPQPFVDGRNYLSSIENGLQETNEVVLSGMAGMGKTTLAGVYASRAGAKYDAIFWIDACSCQSIIKSLLAMLGSSRLQGSSNEVQSLVQVFVTDVLLQATSPWLLIVDELDDQGTLTILDALISFLPSLGSTIYTTRHRNLFGKMSRQPSQIGVEPMSAQDAFTLFELEIQPRLDYQQDPALARRLVDKLGRMPLAISQAARYLKVSHASLEDMLEKCNPLADSQLRQVKLGDAVLIKFLDILPSAPKTLLTAMSHLKPGSNLVDVFETPTTSFSKWNIRDSGSIKTCEESPHLKDCAKIARLDIEVALECLQEFGLINMDKNRIEATMHSLVRDAVIKWEKDVSSIHSLTNPTADSKLSLKTTIPSPKSSSNKYKRLPRKVTEWSLDSIVSFGLGDRMLQTLYTLLLAAGSGFMFALGGLLFKYLAPFS